MGLIPRVIHFHRGTVQHAASGEASIPLNGDSVVQNFTTILILNDNKTAKQFDVVLSPSSDEGREKNLQDSKSRWSRCAGASEFPAGASDPGQGITERVCGLLCTPLSRASAAFSPAALSVFGSVLSTPDNSFQKKINSEPVLQEDWLHPGRYPNSLIKGRYWPRYQSCGSDQCAWSLSLEPERRRHCEC